MTLARISHQVTTGSPAKAGRVAHLRTLAREIATRLLDVGGEEPQVPSSEASESTPPGGALRKKSEYVDFPRQSTNLHYSLSCRRAPATRTRSLEESSGEKCGLDRHRRGFALLAAIFLLVVLAAAGSMMVRLSGSQRQTTSLALMAARCYQAARSGVEWAVYQAIDTPGSCPSGSFALSEGGLDGIQVTVSCGQSSHTEAGTPSDVLVMTSEATYGSFGDRDYVSRRVQVTLK